MIKRQSFGFKTPVRRITKNITGHKVGGDLSGGDVKIKYTNRLLFSGMKVCQFEEMVEHEIELFNRPISIFAIGGYFYSHNNCKLRFSIEIEGLEQGSEVVYNLVPDKWYSLGLDREIDLTEFEIVNKKVIYTISFESDEPDSIIDYTSFNKGMLDYEYFNANTDAYIPFSNSKKEICFPEQFYFQDEVLLEESNNGVIVYKKSCNRCQRFLPINPHQEREALAFSNHCASKAPCTHSTFSNYEIIENDVDNGELVSLLDQTTYNMNENYLKSYYGHQLECKACKKFFVNTALNPLRTSTQHREDSLRRRAIEQLTNNVLGQRWIYHEFREQNQREFDEYIWSKFEKKCFKCGNLIESPNAMHLDHTMPLAYLYPLDVHATCLCATCNNDKSDKFPVNFYTPEELVKLSEITGLPLDVLTSTSSNDLVVIKLKDALKWLLEEFIMHDEYQKEREGKKASDSILHSIQKAINNSVNKYDIMEEYTKQISG